MWLLRNMVISFIIAYQGMAFVFANGDDRTNKVVDESSIETLWTSNRALPPKLLLRLAGKRIAQFCRNSASFLITSSENDETVQLRRKRDIRAEEKQQKSPFTHRSYGHYGHQSHNYAHYGHETYTRGQISSAGESVQKIEQSQIRGVGPPVVPSTGISQSFSPPGSNGYISGSGIGGSEGFSLRTGYEGGYQINQPLGLRAGSQFRGGLNTQGQYATDSRISPSGTSSIFPSMPGLASSGDTTAGIPRLPMRPPTGVTAPGIPSLPSTRSTDEKPSYQEPRDFRRDAQPGFPSPSSGIPYPSDASLAMRRPNLPGYPATVITHPGLALDTAQPAYHMFSQPQCCQKKTEGSAAVSHDKPRISATPMVQPGYPGISQALLSVNGVKSPDYPPSVAGRPAAYPLPGIPAPAHRIPHTTHPGLLPSQAVTKTDHSLSAIITGQAVTTETGLHPTKDTRISKTDYPRLPSPRLDDPSVIITPPDHSHPAAKQPSYPFQRMPQCCQPKEQPHGGFTPSASIPAPGDVRHVETPAVRFDHRLPEISQQSRYPYSAILPPGHPPSGAVSQHSHTLSVPSEHPSQPTVQQIYPIAPTTPGVPACCQPKVQPPVSTLTRVPSIPRKDQTEIQIPDYAHLGRKYPGYPPPTRLPHPDYMPSIVQQPAYASSVAPPPPSFPSPVAPLPGFPSPNTDTSVSQPSYPLYPGQQQPKHRPLGLLPQPTYTPLPGILHTGYPSRDAQYSTYSSLSPPQQTYPSAGVPQPSTKIIPPGSVFPSSQPGYLPARTVYPVQPGYPAQPRETVPVYQPTKTDGARVAHPEHLPPRAPETYPPGIPFPSERTFLPRSTTHPITGEGILTPQGQVQHTRNGLISVRSKDDTAVSQTQVQTGYEGTVAEATSIGRQGRLGAQTQVQGGYTGNGSFSAQAQSGFTGGVTQSQVRGGKQGGLSGSSAQVERVGSAQSQVQVGRPSGAAAGTAQGRFISGVTQVQAQSGRRGGSAGAQAQSMGMSNSQVQMNVADGETQSEDGFQGGVSASVSGGHFGGQAHTQLQGGYNSGRTYVATAQGGFDSTSEFRGSVPTIGTIPGMLVRPLNRGLQPPSGTAGTEYMQPSTSGVLGLPQDHIFIPDDHLRFRPSEADRVYERDYRFPNGSLKVPVNGIRDHTGIRRATEQSRRSYAPSISQPSTNGMIGIPSAVDISGMEQRTHLRYPGFDESARRSSIPAISSTQHIPSEPFQLVQLNGMPERGVFRRQEHPRYVPAEPSVSGALSPFGQRLDTKLQPEGIPASTTLQPSTIIPGPTEIPGSMSTSIDFNGKREMPPEQVIGRVDGRQRVPDLLHPDRGTQIQRVWPSHQPSQFPYDQQQVRPPQETVQPVPHVPATVQPVDSPISTSSRNISRDTRPHLPLTPPHRPFSTSNGDTVADCCKPKRDWRTRCCQSRKFQQNGISDEKPRCCSNRFPDEDEKYPDDDPDFDDGDEDTKDSCRIVKAVCYIVYKPSGRARVCKPTGTRGC